MNFAHIFLQTAVDCLPIFFKVCISVFGVISMCICALYIMAYRGN